MISSPLSVKKIHFIYPSEPFSLKTIDPEYESESKAAEAAGFSFSLLDIEELENNRVVLSDKVHSLSNDSIYIYRGWMLKDEHYSTFFNVFSKHNLTLLTSHSQYLHSHYLPNWYDNLQEFTIPTLFTSMELISKTMKENGIERVFVKDFVKSLTTSRGSIANSIEEANEIAYELKKKRSFIEGGICLREVVDIDAKSEERYFVFNKNVFSREGVQIPEFVKEISCLHSAPFYSIDVVAGTDGELLLVELGDGQVSDTKQWEVKDFYKIFAS